jgi:hypothetical protein
MPGTFQESGSRDLGLKYSTTPNPGSGSGSKSMTYLHKNAIAWSRKP